MFERLLVSWFDFHKKRNMEHHYLHDQVWGRVDTNPEVERARELLSDRRYGRCLDAGTGLGHYAEALAPVCDTIHATDLSPRAVSRARKRLSHLSNVTYEVANIRTFNFNQRFDLILLGDVLYYLGDLRFPNSFRTFISRIADMLEPSGRLFISTAITRGRTEKEAHEYGALFTSYGLLVGHEEVFRNGTRSWVLTVIEKPAQ